MPAVIPSRLAGRARADQSTTHPTYSTPKQSAVGHVLIVLTPGGSFQILSGGVLRNNMAKVLKALK